MQDSRSVFSTWFLSDGEDFNRGSQIEIRLIVPPPLLVGLHTNGSIVISEQVGH